jgi:hypothetical protein
VVPVYSGGPVPDFHRVPFQAQNEHLGVCSDYLLAGRFFVKCFFAVDNAFLFIFVCECKQLRDMCFAGSIGVEPCPDKPGFYRHLDGYTDGAPTSQLGVEEIKVIIKDLDGNDPLLYAAKKAIGPKQLTEEDARNTARRAYSGNTRRLGIPRDRMAKRLGLDQKTIHYHLGKMPVLANSLNADLSRCFCIRKAFKRLMYRFFDLFIKFGFAAFQAAIDTFVSSFIMGTGMNHNCPV